MAKVTWGAWKVATIGMAVVVATALITALVVANWNGKTTGMQQAKQEAGRLAAATSNSNSKGQVRQAAATPSASDIEACNQHAKSVTANNASDVLEKAVIGGALGAGVGAAGGAIAGGGKGAGKGAAIGGIVGATAGTLYGLNEANQKDARAVAAYRACMRERGYTNG